MNNHLSFLSRKLNNRKLSFVSNWKKQTTRNESWLFRFALSQTEFIGKHHSIYEETGVLIFRLTGFKANQFVLFRKYYKQKFPSCFEVCNGHHTSINFYSGKILKPVCCSNSSTYIFTFVRIKLPPTNVQVTVNPPPLSNGKQTYK